MSCMSRVTILFCSSKKGEKDIVIIDFRHMER